MQWEINENSQLFNSLYYRDGNTYSEGARVYITLWWIFQQLSFITTEPGIGDANASTSTIYITESIGIYKKERLAKRIRNIIQIRYIEILICGVVFFVLYVGIFVRLARCFY